MRGAASSICGRSGRGREVGRGEDERRNAPLVGGIASGGGSSVSDVEKPDAMMM